MWEQLTRLKREDRGISAIIVAVSLVALLGVAVLTIDAGSAWATRRNLITGTDAAALAAAHLFADGSASPCTQQGTGQSTANNVLLANNATSTMEGFAVQDKTNSTLSCNTTFAPGHVRVDGRQTANTPFAGVFGFGSTKPFSSSTAEFGYATSCTDCGLRPIAVCDQYLDFSYSSPSVPSFPPPNNGKYPHYYLYWLLQNGYITQSYYNQYFGQGAVNGQGEYPTKSPDGSQTYLTIAQGGGVVHRINTVDTCGGGASWAGWICLDGSNCGSSAIEPWVRNGFPGSVSLSPNRNCNDNNQFPSGDCNGEPGNKNGIDNTSANSLICTLPSAQCPAFPVILDEGVSGNGQHIDVKDVGFVFVILRGWDKCSGNVSLGGNKGCIFDFEFTKRVITTGTIGGTDPTGGKSPLISVALCGADHDTAENRCAV